uniref:Uncharacterized protein n=1 Tax=Ursus americanus TaxID=9643 RepID=A0A452S0P2_URSAM
MRRVSKSQNTYRTLCEKIFPTNTNCYTEASQEGSYRYFIFSLSMTMQFISHQFPDYHDPTIEDAYKTQVRIDNEPAYLDILDTAGQVGNFFKSL